MLNKIEIGSDLHIPHPIVLTKLKPNDFLRFGQSLFKSSIFITVNDNEE